MAEPFVTSQRAGFQDFPFSKQEKLKTQSKGLFTFLRHTTVQLKYIKYEMGPLMMINCAIVGVRVCVCLGHPMSPPVETLHL